jgi:hypothetical protein
MDLLKYLFAQIVVNLIFNNLSARKRFAPMFLHYAAQILYQTNFISRQ